MLLLRPWIPAALLAVLAVLAAASPAGAAEAADAGPAGEPAHVHVVQRGDTLIGLGQRYLADPAGWTELARSNRIRDPLRMPVGRSLRIPLRLMRSEPVPAVVIAASGAASSGGDALVAGQSVPEGAEVRTGADGQVVLRLVDGTVLRLRPAGRLRIDESRRLQGVPGVRSGVQLGGGRAEVRAQPAAGGQPGFRIGTPQGVLAVRGTEFRVAADGGTTRGEVLEGAVAASGAAAGAPGGEQRVGAGRGTVIDAEGRVAAPVALLPAPELAALPALHERPLVRLPLPAITGAVAYRVQVARDAGFELLLADLQSPTPELRIPGLEDGRYAIRLRAIDALGLEGLDAVGTLQLKARPEPPLPRAPVPRAVLRGTQAAFAWAANEQAARYRLQVARADAGERPFEAPLHDLRGIQALEASVEGLAPGAYLWRIASVKADGDQGPFSDALPFEVRALPAQPGPPEPPQVGEGSVRLFWQGSPGQRFDFEVATDAAFTRFFAQMALEHTEIDLPLAGATGRFYVRLRARDPDGYVGPWSATQHFDVPRCVRDAQRGCWQTQGGPLQFP